MIGVRDGMSVRIVKMITDLRNASSAQGINGLRCTVLSDSVYMFALGYPFNRS
jgi:hypothetical protein